MRVLIPLTILVLIGLCAAGALLIAAVVDIAREAPSISTASANRTEISSETAANVCIGLNIFSCRSQQQQERQASDDGNPWPMICMISPVLLVFVYAAAQAIFKKVD